MGVDQVQRDGERMTASGKLAAGIKTKYGIDGTPSVTPATGDGSHHIKVTNGNQTLLDVGMRTTPSGQTITDIEYGPMGDKPGGKVSYYTTLDRNGKPVLDTTRPVYSDADGTVLTKFNADGSVNQKDVTRAQGDAAKAATDLVTQAGVLPAIARPPQAKIEFSSLKTPAGPTAMA
jgi:hypothetical protein